MQELLLTCLMFIGAPENPNEEIKQLFDDVHEFNMRNYPEWATYDGDHRYDDKLADVSDAAVRARYDSVRVFLRRLEQIPYGSLTEDNKVNYAIFKLMYETELEGEKFNSHYMPLTQRWGPQIDFPQLITTAQKLETAEDYEKCFSRMKQLPKQIDDEINNMLAGIRSRLVMPAYLIEKVPAQIEKLIGVPVENSVFYRVPAENSGISPTGRERIENQLRELITNVINLSYKRLLDFINEKYLPGCRRDISTSGLPDGTERYSYAIKSHATVDLKPDEIFELGMKEVERIDKEMEKAKKNTGFKGTLDKFKKFLQTDPKFYYGNKEELLTDYQKILDEMSSKLPSLFGRLPSAKVEIKETEEYRAREATIAEYYSGSDDGSRPGIYYVNTYDLKGHPKFQMVSLTLHESVPGHHLQISIAKKLENLPKFRSDAGFTAFVEGWGLYSEYLGYEAGMYKNAYDKYGALAYENWRAVRLVVDVGIHYKGWTYEQAFEFFKKHTVHNDDVIKAELDRYISWPGQALAYKIGELKIRELRRRAEQELGDKFDVRSFHDEVLKNGAIPLSFLEEVINGWISKQKKN